MNTQTQSKWFYPIQDEISKMIDKSQYTRAGYILWQDVTPERYFECWDLAHNETGKHINMVFVANKATGFIFSYAYNPLNTLQP